MRHSYLFPRVMLTGLALLFGFLAINPLVRTAVVDAVKSTTGATTNLTRVQTSWRNRTVKLIGLTIADPYCEGRDLIQADQVDLQLDGPALLRRRTVVKRGRVHGLRVGTERSSIHSIAPERISAYQTTVAEHFDRVSGDWLEKAASRVKAGWPGEIKSAQLAREFADRWPAEHQAIETDATRLLERATTIQERLERSGENRLRNIATYQWAMGEMETLSRDIEAVERHAAQLQQQMKMDQDALASAGEADALALKQQAGLAEMDAEVLSDYLVGAEVSERLAKVMHWVTWSRRLTPTMVADASKTSKAKRGHDRLFGNQTTCPDVFIESLVLQGQMDLGQGEAPLDGHIKNWSSNAGISTVPTEVVVQTGGATPMLVQAVLDRTTGENRDHIVVDCPRIPCQRRTLGSTDNLSLAVSSGNVHIWCHIDLVGDRMTGKLLLRQRSATFTPQTTPALSSPVITEALATAVRDLDSLDVSVSLSGTITTPEWKIESNLGPHLAAGLQSSFQAQLVSGSQQQMDDARRQALANLATIESQLVERHTTTMESLRGSLASLHEVRASIASRVRLTDGMIDAKSPLRESYQR